MRATRRAARDDPDPQIHAKETILHLLRLLFSPYHLPNKNTLSRSASLIIAQAIRLRAAQPIGLHPPPMGPSLW